MYIISRLLQDVDANVLQSTNQPHKFLFVPTEDSLICPWVRKVSSSMDKPVEKKIKTSLQNALKPTYLEILNESYMHNVPKNAETHFKVIVISEKFEKQPLIRRHRMINELLFDELKTNIHALSIIAKTPSEWNESNKEIDSSPPCRGGFGK